MYRRELPSGSHRPKNIDHICREVPLSGPEANDILTIVKDSLFSRSYKQLEWTVEKIELVNNEYLHKAFHEKYKEMKGMNYTSKELEEKYMFHVVNCDHLRYVVQNGLRAKKYRTNMGLSIGDASKGVYVWPSADTVLDLANLRKYDDPLQVVVFKVILGRSKSMAASRTPPEPTRFCDSHVSLRKPSAGNRVEDIIDWSKVFIYDFDKDGELQLCPRQCLPVAAVTLQRKPRNILVDERSRIDSDKRVHTLKRRHERNSRSRSPVRHDSRKSSHSHSEERFRKQDSHRASRESSTDSNTSRASSRSSESMHGKKKKYRSLSDRFAVVENVLKEKERIDSDYKHYYASQSSYEPPVKIAKQDEGEQRNVTHSEYAEETDRLFIVDDQGVSSVELDVEEVSHRTQKRDQFKGMKRKQHATLPTSPEMVPRHMQPVVKLKDISPVLQSQSFEKIDKNSPHNMQPVVHLKDISPVLNEGGRIKRNLNQKMRRNINKELIDAQLDELSQKILSPTNTKSSMFRTEVVGMHYSPSKKQDSVGKNERKYSRRGDTADDLTLRSYKIPKRQNPVEKSNENEKDGVNITKSAGTKSMQQEHPHLNAGNHSDIRIVEIDHRHNTTTKTGSNCKTDGVSVLAKTYDSPKKSTAVGGADAKIPYISPEGKTSRAFPPPREIKKHWRRNNDAKFGYSTMDRLKEMPLTQQQAQRRHCRGMSGDHEVRHVFHMDARVYQRGSGGVTEMQDRKAKPAGPAVPAWMQKMKVHVNSQNQQNEKLSNENDSIKSSFEKDVSLSPSGCSIDSKPESEVMSLCSIDHSEMEIQSNSPFDSVVSEENVSQFPHEPALIQTTNDKTIQQIRMPNVSVVSDENISLPPQSSTMNSRAEHLVNSDESKENSPEVTNLILSQLIERKAVVTSAKQVEAFQIVLDTFSAAQDVPTQPSLEEPHIRTAEVGHPDDSDITRMHGQTKTHTASETSSPPSIDVQSDAQSEQISSTGTTYLNGQTEKESIAEEKSKSAWATVMNLVGLGSYNVNNEQRKVALNINRDQKGPALVEPTSKNRVRTTGAQESEAQQREQQVVLQAGFPSHVSSESNSDVIRIRPRTMNVPPSSGEENTDMKKHKRRTAPDTAGKFHGRTLLRGEGVPTRIIPLEPLYRIRPYRANGEKEIIPVDPRPQFYANKYGAFAPPSIRIQHDPEHTSSGSVTVECRPTKNSSNKSKTESLVSTLTKALVHGTHQKSASQKVVSHGAHVRDPRLARRKTTTDSLSLKEVHWFDAENEPAQQPERNGEQPESAERNVLEQPEPHERKDLLEATQDAGLQNLVDDFIEKGKWDDGKAVQVVSGDVEPVKIPTIPLESNLEDPRLRSRKDSESGQSQAIDLTVKASSGQNNKDGVQRFSANDQIPEHASHKKPEVNHTREFALKPVSGKGDCLTVSECTSNNKKVKTTETTATIDRITSSTKNNPSKCNQRNIPVQVKDTKSTSIASTFLPTSAGCNRSRNDIQYRSVKRGRKNAPSTDRMSPCPFTTMSADLSPQHSGNLELYPPSPPPAANVPSQCPSTATLVKSEIENKVQPPPDAVALEDMAKIPSNPPSFVNATVRKTELNRSTSSCIKGKGYTCTVKSSSSILGHTTGNSEMATLEYYDTAHRSPVKLVIDLAVDGSEECVSDSEVDFTDKPFKMDISEEAKETYVNGRNSKCGSKSPLEEGEISQSESDEDIEPKISTLNDADKNIALDDSVEETPSSEQRDKMYIDTNESDDIGSTTPNNMSNLNTSTTLEKFLTRQQLGKIRLIQLIKPKCSGALVCEKKDNVVNESSKSCLTGKGNSCSAQSSSSLPIMTSAGKTIGNCEMNKYEEEDTTHSSPGKLVIDLTGDNSEKYLSDSNDGFIDQPFKKVISGEAKQSLRVNGSDQKSRSKSPLEEGGVYRSKSDEDIEPKASTPNYAVEALDLDDLIEKTQQPKLSPFDQRVKICVDASESDDMGPKISKNISDLNTSTALEKFLARQQPRKFSQIQLTKTKKTSHTYISEKKDGLEPRHASPVQSKVVVKHGASRSKSPVKDSKDQRIIQVGIGLKIPLDNLPDSIKELMQEDHYGNLPLTPTASTVLPGLAMEGGSNTLEVDMELDSDISTDSAILNTQSHVEIKQKTSAFVQPYAKPTGHKIETIIGISNSFIEDQIEQDQPKRYTPCTYDIPCEQKPSVSSVAPPTEPTPEGNAPLSDATISSWEPVSRASTPELPKQSANLGIDSIMVTPVVNPTSWNPPATAQAIQGSMQPSVGSYPINPVTQYQTYATYNSVLTPAAVPYTQNSAANLTMYGYIQQGVYGSSMLQQDPTYQSTSANYIPYTVWQR